MLGTVASGQGQGVFEIPATTPAGANPFFDQTTGMTRCTINWRDNIGLTSVNLMRVDVFVGGTSVCLENATSANPTVIHPGFTTANFPRTFTSNSISITRSGFITMPNPRPYSAPNTPFIVLQFRALPGALYNVNVSGWVTSPSFLIASASTTGTPLGFNIAGSITKPINLNDVSCDASLGDGIPNVTVSKTATVQTPCFPGVAVESGFYPFGFYEFNQNVGSQGLYFTEYQVRPSKTTSTDVCCGVNYIDYLLWPNDWLLGINGTLTNAELLAADFSGDGFLSTLDKILISKCVLGLQLPPSEPNSGLANGWLPWRFAPYAGFLPDAQITSGLGNVIPDRLTLFYNPLTGGLNVPTMSFWGVKRGDMNGSCEACGASIISDVNDSRTVQQRPDAKIQLNIPDIGMNAGQEALVPIKTGMINGAGDILLELMFDQNTFEVLSIEKGDLKDDYVSSGIVPEHNGVAVKYGWFNMEQQGVDFREQTVLFYVKVRAKKEVISLKNLIWLRAAGDINLLMLRGSKATKRFALTIAPSAQSVFSATLHGENPMRETTQVLVKTPASCTVNFSIIDGNGHQLGAFSRALPEGSSEIQMQELPNLAGIYTIRVQSPFGQSALRLVKL